MTDLGVLQPFSEQFGFDLVAFTLTRVVGEHYKWLQDPLQFFQHGLGIKQMPSLSSSPKSG